MLFLFLSANSFTFQETNQTFRLPRGTYILMCPRTANERDGPPWPRHPPNRATAHGLIVVQPRPRNRYLSLLVTAFPSSSPSTPLSLAPYSPPPTVRIAVILPTPFRMVSSSRATPLLLIPNAGFSLLIVAAGVVVGPVALVNGAIPAGT